MGNWGSYNDGDKGFEFNQPDKGFNISYFISSILGDLIFTMVIVACVISMIDFYVKKDWFNFIIFIAILIFSIYMDIHFTKMFIYNVKALKDKDKNDTE